jgi:hypothetical protein
MKRWIFLLALITLIAALAGYFAVSGVCLIITVLLTIISLVQAPVVSTEEDEQYNNDF